MNTKLKLTVAVLAACVSTAVFAEGKREPAAGTSWTEPRTGMEFVWIPTGCFQMGSSEGDKDENPVHKVCVKGFWMGKYEVTQGQYQQVMGNNPSKFQGSNRPVEMVDWSNAKVMAEEMSYSTGTKVRLPTEAEWEYACRAGGAHETYCGGGGRPDRLAWYNGNSDQQTHPVGQLAANDWGLYDMSGNVWEWVSDTYHDSYNGAPADGSAWGGGEKRVLRGGSLINVAQSARAANRSYDVPAERDARFGFRLARTLP